MTQPDNPNPPGKPPEDKGARVLQAVQSKRDGVRLLIYMIHLGCVTRVQDDEATIEYDVDGNLVKHQCKQELFVDGILPKKGEHVEAHVCVITTDSPHQIEELDLEDTAKRFVEAIQDGRDDVRLLIYEALSGVVAEPDLNELHFIFFEGESQVLQTYRTCHFSGRLPEKGELVESHTCIVSVPPPDAGAKQ